MSIINAIILTLSPIILTLTGDAPIEIWFPLIEDIFNNLLGVIL